MSPILTKQFSKRENQEQNEIIIPDWINDKIFTDLISKQFGTDFRKIENFTVKAIKRNNPLENSPIQVYHIQILVQLKDNKQKTVIYFIKTPKFAQQLHLNSLSTADFQKEQLIYTELLPKFEEFYEDAAYKQFFAPKNYKLLERSTNDYIVLENLQERKFRQPNSLAGLNMIQTKAVLEKLAALHAASAKYVENKGRLPLIFTKTTLRNDIFKNDQESGVNEQINRKFRESVRLYNLYHYEDKVQIYQRCCFNTIPNLSKYDPQEFNVLLHGNLCCNNIHFDSDAFGNVKQTLFTNFEMSSYGSPAKDLLVLLFSSTSCADRLKHFDFFVKYYHDQLIKSLKMLKFRGAKPKLSELHLDILKYSSWAFIALSRILPHSFMNQTADFNNDVDFYLKSFYGNNQYAQQMEEMIPWLENRAFLEV